MKKFVKKQLVRFLKWCLRKLGAIKRVEYVMPMSQRKINEQLNEMKKYSEFIEKAQKDRKEVSIKSEYPKDNFLFFEHNFNVYFNDIPPHLFCGVKKIQQGLFEDCLYEFEFFISNFNDTDIIKKMKELQWKTEAENFELNINIDVVGGNGETFKKIEMKKCKINNISFFENFSYYSNELLKGKVIIHSDSISIE